MIAILPKAWVAKVVRSPFQENPNRKEYLEVDGLFSVQAQDYIYKLTRRDVIEGWVQCPFHADGAERTPSLQAQGNLWCCYGSCEPEGSQEVFGGNIITFAAKLWGYNPRPRGDEFLEVKKRLEKEFECG